MTTNTPPLCYVNRESPTVLINFRMYARACIRELMRTVGGTVIAYRMVPATPMAPRGEVSGGPLALVAKPYLTTMTGFEMNRLGEQTRRISRGIATKNRAGGAR